MDDRNQIQFPQEEPTVPQDNSQTKVLIGISLLVLISVGAIIAYFILNRSTSENTLNEDNIQPLTEESLPEDDSGFIPALALFEAQTTIENSIPTKSYADLLPYMAGIVTFEIESEEIPSAEPREAIENLNYLNSSIVPWNFDQSSPNIAEIKSQHSEEYGKLFIGVSSNEYLVAFGFDDNGQIDLIKVSNSYRLLTTE